MRVFNLGPVRIALGNLRLPPGQQNDPNQVRNAMDQLREQALQVGQGQNAPVQQNLNVTQTLENASVAPIGPVADAVALHPFDVQSDILRIQRNILESMRQLNAQHEQLEVLHRLLVELNRIQQASGSAHELPNIAPLHAPIASSFVPQAYFPGGPILRQGDDGIPEGLTLPEGWTLRPMTLARQDTLEASDANSPVRQSSDGVAGAVVPSAAAAIPPSHAEASTSAPIAHASANGPSTRPTEPSSLESSWSFGNAGERNEAEGASSGIARSSSEGTATRRAVTVEDAEDNGQ